MKTMGSILIGVVLISLFITTPVLAGKSNPQKIKDFGMTDNIHAAHMQEVVFSKKPIAFKKGNEQQLCKKFNLATDDIFFMAYFRQSYYNQAADDNKLSIIENADGEMVNRGEIIYWEVNGKTVGKNAFSSVDQFIGANEGHFKTWTGRCNVEISLTKLAGVKVSDSKIQRSFCAYVLPNLKAGDNEVKMHISFHLYKSNTKEVIYEPAKPMATGSFTLVVSKKEDILAHYKKVDLLLQSTFNNAQLEKEIKADFAGKNVAKVIFRKPDWMVNKEYNVIKYRSMPLYVIIEEDGKYFAYGYSANQDYIGGGQYAKTKITPPLGGDIEIPAILLNAL